MRKSITLAWVCLALMATSFVEAHQKPKSKPGIFTGAKRAEEGKANLKTAQIKKNVGKGKTERLPLYRSPVQVVGYTFDEVVL